MKLRITVGNVELELDEPELINEALVDLGYDDINAFIDRASECEQHLDWEKRAYPLQTMDHSIEKTQRALRSPPDPRVRDSVVQYRSSDNSGPLCEECQEPIAPLDEDSALELYSRVLCLSCGKELE